MMMRGRRKPDVDLLQACLEEILSGRESLAAVLAQYPEHAGWLRPELETALRLAAMQEALGPRPGFVSASRQRLVTQFFLPAQWGKRAPVPLFFRNLGAWPPRRLAFQAALALLVGVCVLTGVVLSHAAQGALPGEVFYPVKTFSENLQLSLSLTAARRTQLTLDYAGRRITEIEALMLEGGYDRAAATLNLFDQQVGQATALLEDYSRQNVGEARELAQKLIRLLEDESRVSSLLLASAPEHLKAQLDEAIHNSQDRAMEIQALFADLGSLQPGAATPKNPSQTLAPMINTVAASPTAQGEKAEITPATPTPTPRLAAVPRPTSTLTSAAVVKFTQTPKPSRTPTPTYTPQPTDTPTLKPTNTRRPTLTRRPTRTEKPRPKPTRTKKP